MMITKMILKTEEEANKIQCPFMNEYFPHKTNKCVASNCMAWVEYEPRVERENHSNAFILMNELARERETSVKREGPNGCTGLLIIEARGFCGRIFKEFEK